jgi:hypothetical protein
MVDLGVGVAALFLLVAAAGGGLALWGARGPWRMASLAARLLAVVALGVASVLAAAGNGVPSPFDLRQVMLALALVSLIADLALAALLRIEGAGPALDLLVLALLVLDLLLVGSSGALAGCTPFTVLFWLQWTFFLFGAGSALAAGGAALAWGFQAARPGLQWPPNLERHRLLIAATSLALIGLGAGLAISAWWAWRTVGGLDGGDPRQAWMAITWLLLAMSLLAWQLEEAAARWAAALAGLAATVAVVGLLAVPHIVRLLGF